MDCVDRGILTLVGLFPLVLLAASAEARLNLLQSKQVTTLPGNLVGSIRASLEPSPTGPVAFAAPIQAALLRALPQDFRAACPSLIESWGDIARGTDESRGPVQVRQPDQVGLAFRCDAPAPEQEKDHAGRPCPPKLRLSAEVKTREREFEATSPKEVKDFPWEGCKHHSPDARRLPGQVRARGTTASLHFEEIK